MHRVENQREISTLGTEKKATVLHSPHRPSRSIGKSGTRFQIHFFNRGFTKFIRLYPCKSTTSEEALKHLDNYFRAYSKPKRIVSNRGTCFTSSKFTTTLKELDI